MPEREIVGLIGLAVLFALLMARAPVGLAMIAVGIGGNFALSLTTPYLKFWPYLKQFKSMFWSTMASYELSVIPLFILMGYLASHAGLSRDLFHGLNALVGRFRGGVAMAAVGACAGFGAVSGSSLATASTMGRVALPELDRLRYARTLATGTLAAGGTLGILIPPSVALVLYAIIVEASIIKMFQAAILPGLLAVLSFLLVIFVLVRLRPELAPQTHLVTGDQRHIALRRLIPVLTIFGAIIIGLGVGLFAPTPAAAVGAALVLAYGLWLRGRDSKDGLTAAGTRDALLDTAATSGMIYFILFGAEVMRGFLSRAGLPAAMASWTSNSGLDPWTLLIVLLVILILLGCFLESLSMILVVVPFFWPALVQLNGGDFVTPATAAFGMSTDDLKIWFGILALIVVELGLITPPVGLNLFIISNLAAPRTDRDGKAQSSVYRGVLPFLVAELLRIVFILAIPALCLFLPHLLSG